MPTGWRMREHPQIKRARFGGSVNRAVQPMAVGTQPRTRSGGGAARNVQFTPAAGPLGSCVRGGRMTDEPSVHRPQPLWVYLVLYLPYGMAAGYVNVTLAWLLSHAGATVAAIAVLGSMALLPNTWKVLWAPLVDTTLSAKRWFLIGLVVSALGIGATAFLPLRLDLMVVFEALVLATSFFGTLTAIAVDRFMAFDVPDEAKGRAGGWSQAGNLGGSGLGGGLALVLAQHSGHPWIGGAILVP